MDIKEGPVDKFSTIDTDLVDSKLNNLNMQTNSDYVDKMLNSSSTTSTSSCSTNSSNNEQTDQFKFDKMIQANKSNQEKSTTNLIASNGLRDEKRMDYLIWEDYFMSVALLSAKRSKDPSTQVGACIVNNDNKIVSIGYNGMPINCNDDLLPWGKNSENELDNKYLYVCHAELNCVLNSSTFSLKGCSIYVTLFPCNECAKVIIQSGIKKIYYLDKKKDDKPEYIASKRLLDMANVKLVHYKPKETEVVLKLKASD